MGHAHETTTPTRVSSLSQWLPLLFTLSLLPLGILLIKPLWPGVRVALTVVAYAIEAAIFYWWKFKRHPVT